MHWVEQDDADDALFLLPGGRELSLERFGKISGEPWQYAGSALYPTESLPLPHAHHGDYRLQRAQITGWLPQ